MPDDRHQQGYEVYAAAGPKRAYRHVADQLGVSERTVRHWAKKEKWRERLAEREAQVARQIADQVIGSATVNATRKRKMVELALMKVIKAINGDKVRIQIGDLDRLLRLQAFLDGDAGVMTGEIFRQRPVREILNAFYDWGELLTLDDAEVVQEVRMQRKARREGTQAQPVPAISPAAATGATPPGVTVNSTPTPEDQGVNQGSELGESANRK